METVDMMSAFRRAHDGLPREAPGSERTTRLLLEMCGPLPAAPRVVDIGCGTGPATLVLAELTGGTVDAVDLHEPYLTELGARARAAGVDGRVRTHVASMQDLPFPDTAFDLVWAEGSAYVMGFDAALAAWRRLVAPGGALVLTEAEWTTPDPSTGAREFWDEAYPSMRTTGENVRAAQETGWTVAGTYLLPDVDWDAYYEPLASNLDRMRDDGVSPALVDDVGHEIEVRRAHGADYGYTGYVLRPR
ncbi:class I SAM-dependent methyltransferase [Pseudonocardia endophytica]|nr:class I SAM-dependent methyltransferase [Pseudonocardia endophytica]